MSVPDKVVSIVEAPTEEDGEPIVSTNSAGSEDSVTPAETPDDRAEEVSETKDDSSFVSRTPSGGESATSPTLRSARRKNSGGKKRSKKRKSREKMTLDGKEDVAQRNMLINELLDTEKAHVQAIDSVVNNYLFPLRNNNQDILPYSTIQDIFSNIELIRNWHRAFLSQLSAHLHCGETFGTLFLEMIPVLRQLYTQYNENYEHAMETYEKAKKIKPFALFLEKKQAELNDSKALLTYLYLPVQRMIAYDSLLKDILSLTPPNHEDYYDLSSALQSLRDIQLNASLRAKQRKNIDKVIEIQNRIAGTTQLALPHRRYVYEGKVLFIGPDGTTSSKRFCYLFNDLFVCCKEKRKVLEVDFKEPLETLKVEDMSDTEDYRYLFKLTSSANEYVFSTTDKHHWMSLIAQYVKMKAASEIITHTDGEESREMLISQIIQWGTYDDPEQVFAEVKALAEELAKRR